MPSLKSRVDIREQRTAYLAGFVSLDPEVSLEVLEIGDLYIARYEVVDMCSESGGRGAIFGGEVVTVWAEGRGVPLCG